MWCVVFKAEPSNETTVYGPFSSFDKADDYATLIWRSPGYEGLITTVEMTEPDSQKE